MMSFKTDLEANAQQKAAGGKPMEYPPELLDAYIMDRTGWDIFKLRATPKHVIENLLLYYHIKTMYESRYKPPKP